MKTIGYIFFITLALIVVFMFIAIYTVEKREEIRKEKCREIGLVYHKPFNSEGLCIEGVEVE